MAKAAKKKKISKKSARVSAKPKASMRSAKPAKKKKASKIDPLNRKQYGAMTPMLTVRDVRRAMDFYQKAFGFTVRGIMDSPQGAIHA
jgi:hypothetical protein